MKKIIIMIAIVAIIFVGMIIYKNVIIKNNTITIQEVERIEEYINQIYMWKEITNEALPVFDDINQAPDEWIWEVVKKNSEEEVLSSEQIKEKARELFGEMFDRTIPEQGTKYLIPTEEKGTYQAIGVDLDQQVDLFLLDKINKTENGYEVDIIEFLEDDTPMMGDESENYILIKNLNNEDIAKISGTSEDEERDIVKRHSEKFSKKKISLRKDKEKLYVEKVWR